jgi:hypothetical protein
MHCRDESDHGPPVHPGTAWQLVDHLRGRNQCRLAVRLTQAPRDRSAKSSCAASCFTLFRAASCESVSAASSPTEDAATCCQSAGNFSQSPRLCRARQRKPKSPARGAAPVVAAPWHLLKSSPINKSCEDLLVGRVQLTPRNRRSSPNQRLAPARKSQVCANTVGGPKSEANKTPLGGQRLPPFTSVHRCPGTSLQTSKPTDSPTLGFLCRLNTHSPPASAANTGGLLQTSLSEATRRSQFGQAPALPRRVTPDRVIAYLRSVTPHVRQTLADRRHRSAD